MVNSEIKCTLICKCNCYHTGNYTNTGDDHITVTAEQLTGELKGSSMYPILRDNWQRIWISAFSTLSR
jgi:hypothetical protein